MKCFNHRNEMKFIFVLLFFLENISFAQQIEIIKRIPRDTSFTLYGTEIKIHKQYPFAKLVSYKVPKGVVEKKNLVYVTYGSRLLHLDLFHPKKKSKKAYPAILLIHGGGWSSGNSEMEYSMAIHLALHGYVSVTPEYRLSPEAKYPASIYDLKAAVRWLRANASKYNIDTNKISVYGVSSGGHLAAFLGVTNGLKKFEGFSGNLDHSSNVEAVIDIDGILDFTTPSESGHDNNPKKPSPGKKWLGASIKENKAIWIEASPITYVGENSVPMLFINSSNPRFHAGRDSVISILNKYHIYSEIHTIDNTPHTFWLFHPGFDEAYNFIQNFLDKLFKEK